MTSPIIFLRACAGAALSATLAAHAGSFTSSASSAGSASSGSVSDSLRGSSNSSTDDGAKTADAEYRIIEVAEAPDRAGIARITLQAHDPQQRMVLDLPRAVADRQGLSPGDIVRTRKRVYGFEFARGDTQEAFYLVLADDWHGEMAARPVHL